MLVLSRKTKQRIQIGNDIVITVLRIKGQSVRIGIEAPREVNVARGELDSLRAVEPVVRAAPRATRPRLRAQRAGSHLTTAPASTAPSQALAPVVTRECTMTSQRRPGPAPLSERLQRRLRPEPAPAIVAWQPAAPR